jgi:hypothetical protein
MLILTLTAGEGEVSIPEVDLQPKVKEVSVPVIVENVKGAMAIWLEIEFDSKMIEATEIIYSDAVKDMMRSDNITPGKIIIAMAGVNARNLDGELLKIRFRLSDKVKDGSSIELRISKVDFNEGAIKVKVRDGVINVGRPSSLKVRSKQAITWGWMKTYARRVGR